VKQPVKKFVPMWAFQFVIGLFVVLVAVALAAALLGPVMRGPTAFFDELGKTISRIAPQPQADIRTDDQLKAVIKAMPEGKLRVGAIVEEQNRVVFTVTADRSAVKAAVQPGDEVRIARWQRRDRAHRNPWGHRLSATGDRRPQAEVLRALKNPR